MSEAEAMDLSFFPRLIMATFAACFSKGWTSSLAGQDLCCNRSELSQCWVTLLTSDLIYRSSKNTELLLPSNATFHQHYNPSTQSQVMLSFSLNIS